MTARPALLVAAGLGCEPVPLSEGIGPPLQSALRECEKLDGAPRDWCAVEAVNSAFQMPGHVLAAVCLRMRDSDARDRCIERTVRQPNEPAGVELCEEVDRDVLRDSCHLAAADRAMNGPIEQVVETCRGTRSLATDCAAHVVTYRMDWWQSGHADAFPSDVAALVAAFPEAAAIPLFAKTVGSGGRRLGYWGTDSPVCAVFAGDATAYCTDSLMGIPDE